VEALSLPTLGTVSDPLSISFSSLLFTHQLLPLCLSLPSLHPLLHLPLLPLPSFSIHSLSPAVTYAVPSLGSNYAIPTVAKGGNHTSPFTLAARSEAAHRATLKASVGLAVLGARVLMERGFRKKVRETFERGELA